MKTSRNTTNKQNKQGQSKPRPDVRDDLDSRERSEGNGTKKKASKKSAKKR